MVIDHRALAARGFQVAPVVDGHFNAALVILPRAKAEARARIADAYLSQKGVELVIARSLTALSKGKEPGPEMSIRKTSSVNATPPSVTPIAIFAFSRISPNTSKFVKVMLNCCNFCASLVSLAGPGVIVTET